MKLKGYVSIFTYEKAWGFGFNDAGPALMYGSLAKSNQRLTGPWLHNIWIKTHYLALELRQNMRLTKGCNHNKL